MLRRLCFVLSLGTVVSLVGTVRGQQAIQEAPNRSASSPSAAQGPLKGNQTETLKREDRPNWPPAWERQNLLHDYHFIAGTNELNQAGQFRLRWILFKAPAKRRTVFVERLKDDPATADRIVAVRKAIAQLAPGAAGLPVYESNLEPGEWTAGDEDMVRRGGGSSPLPDPRLPRAVRPAISN